jgi:hypothetical protein
MEGLRGRKISITEQPRLLCLLIAALRIKPSYRGLAFGFSSGIPVRSAKWCTGAVSKRITREAESSL